MGSRLIDLLALVVVVVGVGLWSVRVSLIVVGCLLLVVNWLYSDRE